MGCCWWYRSSSMRSDCAMRDNLTVNFWFIYMLNFITVIARSRINDFWFIYLFKTIGSDQLLVSLTSWVYLQNHFLSLSRSAISKRSSLHTLDQHLNTWAMYGIHIYFNIYRWYIGDLSLYYFLLTKNACFQFKLVFRSYRKWNNASTKLMADRAAARGLGVLIRRGIKWTLLTASGQRRALLIWTKSVCRRRLSEASRTVKYLVDWWTLSNCTYVDTDICELTVSWWSWTGLSWMGQSLSV